MDKNIIPLYSDAQIAVVIQNEHGFIQNPTLMITRVRVTVGAYSLIATCDDKNKKFEYCYIKGITIKAVQTSSGLRFPMEGEEGVDTDVDVIIVRVASNTFTQEGYVCLSCCSVNTDTNWKDGSFDRWTPSVKTSIKYVK